jgi:hypothetical protein
MAEWATATTITVMRRKSGGADRGWSAFRSSNPSFASDPTFPFTDAVVPTVSAGSHLGALSSDSVSGSYMFATWNGSKKSRNSVAAITPRTSHGTARCVVGQAFGPPFITRVWKDLGDSLATGCDAAWWRGIRDDFRTALLAAVATRIGFEHQVDGPTIVSGGGEFRPSGHPWCIMLRTTPLMK